MLQNAKDRYHNGDGNEKAVENYIEKIYKEVLKENKNNKYRNLSEEKKESKKEYGRNRYWNISEDKKNKP